MGSTMREWHNVIDVGCCCGDATGRTVDTEGGFAQYPQSNAPPPGIIATLMGCWSVLIDLFVAVALPFALVIRAT